MKSDNRTLAYRLLAVILIMTTGGARLQAQTVARDSVDRDSIFALTPIDSLLKEDAARIEEIANQSAAPSATDTLLQQAGRTKRDWSTWTPDPQRALWLAMVIPGAGQIYNRKYWKLPIVYGGFMGCVYAMSWNNMMYKDYSQAYLDIMDDDPGTKSYEQFLHLGAQITDQNMDRYKQIFKSRKDKYRRWRDLSFFVMVGVYALSVIDAYVDAELSVFDISRDLSLRVEPAVIGSPASRNPLEASAVGLNCSLNF